MYLAEKLNEKIYYYKEVLDDPTRVVALLEENDLNEEIYPVIPKWANWLSNSGDGYAFGGKKDFNIEGLQNLQEGKTKEDAEYLIKEIRGAIEKIANAFVKDYGLDIEPNISPFAGVMKYTPGLEMGAHFDAQAGDESLWWSIVVYLNDNYEGGELSWVLHNKDLRNPKYHNLKPRSDLYDPLNENLIDFWIKPVAGSALIFPSTFPYRHQVHIMKEGNKYMFPGFIFQPDYNPYDEASVEKYNGGSKVVRNSYIEDDENE